MSTKVEEYRRRAEEADRKAEEVTDPVAKRAYWGVAHSYRELVALAERTDAKFSK